MVDIYLQLGAIVQRKATIAAQSADYWERTMQIAVTPEARVRARAYAKMWREEWLKLHNRTCAYVQRSVE